MRPTFIILCFIILAKKVKVMLLTLLFFPSRNQLNYITEELRNPFR